MYPAENGGIFFMSERLQSTGFSLKGGEILALPYSCPVLFTSSSIRKEIAKEFGYSVLTVSGWLGDKMPEISFEDKTQKTIYSESSKTIGITPWRRDINSPPVNLELAVDKAKELLVLREKLGREFFLEVKKKMIDFRKKNPHQHLLDEGLIKVLIATDLEINSLYLILDSLTDFFVVDSAWTIKIPDGFDLSSLGIIYSGGDNRFILHKPKNNADKILETLSLALRVGGHLMSTSGVVQVHRNSDGSIVVSKKLIEIDFGELNPEDFLEKLQNMMEENSHHFAGGFSTFDLLNFYESIFKGKKAKIRIEDYDEKNSGNSGILVFNHKKNRTKKNGPLYINQNPIYIKEFKLTLTPENFLNIIALSVGVEPR